MWTRGEGAAVLVPTKQTQTTLKSGLAQKTEDMTYRSCLGKLPQSTQQIPASLPVAASWYRILSHHHLGIVYYAGFNWLETFDINILMIV